MKFKKLYESYGKCFHPKAVISINNKDEDKEVKEIHLSLSMMEKANACTILYELDTEKELLEIKKKAMIGTVIKLSLGYEQSVTCVFLGYLHSVEIRQLLYTFEIELYAQDVKGLMMNQQRFIHYKEKNAQKILEDIIKDKGYKKFIRTQHIAQQKDMYDTYTQWANSDYETMKSICEEKNMVFYVRGDDFIVEEIGTPLTPEIVFSNFGLMEVALHHCATSVKDMIQLQGYDKEYKNMEYKQKITLPKKTCDTSTFQGFTQIKHYDNFVDQNALKIKGKRMEKQMILGISTIHFSCVYVPELQCGQIVNFTSIACIQSSCIISELEVTLQGKQFSCKGSGMLI